MKDIITVCRVDYCTGTDSAHNPHLDLIVAFDHHFSMDTQLELKLAVEKAVRDAIEKVYGT